MLPAVFSYLRTISSFVLSCEKMRKTRFVCILTMGFVRSLFCSTDFALRDDVVAAYLRL